VACHSKGGSKLGQKSDEQMAAEQQKKKNEENAYKDAIKKIPGSAGQAIRPMGKHAVDADGPVGVTGHRHGHRSRSLMGTFGRTEIEVPRARLDGVDGKTTEWKNKTLRAYQRRTLAADALIAGTYLAGTNTRRVRRALAALFGGCGRQGHGEPGMAVIGGKCATCCGHTAVPSTSKF
jgi:hypothetical protein